MATFLRYVVYVLIILAVYFVGKGVYDGSITSDSTVGEVASQVNADTKTMAKDAARAVGRAVGQVEQKNG